MKQAKTLTDAEVRQIFRIVESRRYGRRDRAILALSFFAGLRAKEIASLTVGDVVDPDGSLQREILLRPSQTKGRRARRVFVSDRLAKELRTYLAGIAEPGGTDAPLFSTQKGHGFTANAMVHLFADIYAQAGLRGASSHSGRRTFITTLASKGVGVRLLAELAGHESISTTMRYIDVNDSQLRAAVELV